MKKYLYIITGMAIATFAFFAVFNLTKSVFASVTQNLPAPVSGYQSYTFFATSTNAGSYMFADNTSLWQISTSTGNATSTNILSWTDVNGRIDNGAFYALGAQKVEFYFSTDATTTNPSSNVKWRVQGSPDGTHWVDFPKLVLSTSTTKTTVSAIYWSGGTTTIPVALDLTDDSFQSYRCIVSFLSSGVDRSVYCAATARY